MEERKDIQWRGDNIFQTLKYKSLGITVLLYIFSFVLNCNVDLSSNENFS